jgi:hypothetical protein
MDIGSMSFFWGVAGCGMMRRFEWCWLENASVKIDAGGGGPKNTHFFFFFFFFFWHNKIH